MPEAPSSADRFRELDRYRVDREWKRYEGTPQRDLFRELRRRFLRRHGDRPGWIADLGSGPGRFADDLGPAASPRALVDLSLEALRAGRTRPRLLRRSRGGWSYVRADVRTLPFRPASCGTVALLGNVFGFAGEDADRALGAACELVAPDGVLLVEGVAGPGERSRYLTRLPEGAVRRALVGPARWLDARVEHEGFESADPRREEGAGDFRRIPVDQLARRLTSRGFRILEVSAIAPAVGVDPDRVAAIASEPAAREGLLRLEERLGRDAARWERAAAFLAAAVRTGTSPDPPATAPSEAEPRPSAGRAKARRPRRESRRPTSNNN